jgi:tetratricopeptide (TPR) repeat protein/Mn-dependent DtxR family transcriptional regulator
MSTSKSLNIPPLELIDKKLTLRRDYEQIILWMLNNNEYCEWANFIEEPIDIKKSTLSDKLRSLISKGFVEKESKETEKGIKKVYLITSTGRERYNEISISEEERFNYPPRKILNKRNYDHWILWMVYNNDSCSWSTFTAEDSKVRINQSSLSKNINKLLDNGSIIKVNKEYKITPEGRAEYSSMLREYDLDRQSILEEETNRIDEITEKTSEFFDFFDIEDEELKFRFINNILKLDYSEAKEFVEEDEFNKIILFLSMNHPDQFPNYTSPEDFSLKYGVKKTTLDFFVDKIVEEQFYPIKFFKLITEDDKIYYFQINGELEKILNAVVEKHITKFTYLNKFHSKSENGNGLIKIDDILNQILEIVSGFLFNEELQKSVKKFLPEYINYLAYKIETEKPLIRSEDKLEAVQWQAFQSIFEAYDPTLMLNGNGNGEQYYRLQKSSFEVLDVTYLNLLDFTADKDFEDEFFSIENRDTFRKVVSKLKRYKIDKARNIFEENIEKFTSDEKLIVKALILNSKKDFEATEKISKNLISTRPNSYIGYLFHAVTLFELSEYKVALGIIEEGLKHSDHYSLDVVKAQNLIKISKTKDALRLMQEALARDPKNTYLLRTKFLILITDESCYAECLERPLDIINEVISLKPDNLSFHVLKAATLCSMQKYKEAKKVLNKEIDLRLLLKNPRISTAVSFLLTYSYVARDKFEKALKKADELIIQYDSHPISYFAKAFAIGYGLIYDKEYEFISERNFLEILEKAISLDPIKFHHASYYKFKSEVFSKTRGFEPAFDVLEEAFKLDPANMALFEFKMKLLMTSNKTDEAIAFITQLYEEKFIIEKDYLYLTSFLYYVKADQTKDHDKRMELINSSFKQIEPLIDKFPEDVAILNNLTTLYAQLGRKEEAIKAAEKMIRLDPSDGNLLDSYGEIFMIFGEYEKAIEKYEKALKLEPKGWFAFQTYLKMGTCYEKLMDLGKAEENYLKGEELTKKMHPLKRDLYFHKASEKLEGLKKLKEELKAKKQ